MKDLQKTLDNLVEGINSQRKVIEALRVQLHNAQMHLDQDSDVLERLQRAARSSGELVKVRVKSYWWRGNQFGGRVGHAEDIVEMTNTRYLELVAEEATKPRKSDWGVPRNSFEVVS